MRWVQVVFVSARNVASGCRTAEVGLARMNNAQKAGRFKLKRESGDYLQSHAENPVSRYKRIISGRLLSQWDEARERETPTRLLPIEVKTSRTLGKRDLRGLTAFLKEYAEQHVPVSLDPGGTTVVEIQLTRR